MKNNPRCILNKMICLLLVCLTLGSVFTLCACKKPQPQNEERNPFNDFINDAQKLKLETLAEAFAESGFTFDGNNPITFKEIEYFLYFYYNDKVIAGDDGYAKVSAADADKLTEEIFGVKATMRYNHTFEDEVLFYFDRKSETYFIKPKDSFGSRVEMKAIELLHNGGYLATIDVDGTDGSECMLDISFIKIGDSVRVSSCKRYDFN